MTRRLLNLLTAMSLLLCVAAVSLWPYSYFAYDAVGFWPSPSERRAHGLLAPRDDLRHQRGGGRRREALDVET